MTTYPLQFEPIFREKVWGGRTLETLGKTLPPGSSIGESWEISDLPEDIPGGQSIISNGLWTGQTLGSVIAGHAQEILGRAAPAAGGGFPLLVKYLDARENLSVQVHPDAAYAAAHPEAHLKNEAWVVVRADPGAVIYKGLKPGLTRQDIAAHARSGAIRDDLIAVRARPGDCHYLPSGTCHALGAGVVVAEIQTPSDTTFRLYDWGRTGRALHLEQALQCIRLGGGEDESSRPAKPIEVPGFITRSLCRTEFFDIERIDAHSGTTLEVVTNQSPVVWMTLAGSGRVRTPGVDDVEFRTGITMLMPAALQRAEAIFEETTSFLRITTPSWTRTLIAQHEGSAP